MGNYIHFLPDPDTVELSWWLSNKESDCNAGDAGLIPGWGRSPGEGHGNPLQYSCLENTMDSQTWWDRVHRVTKSQTQLRKFSMHATRHTHVGIINNHISTIAGNLACLKSGHMDIQYPFRLQGICKPHSSFWNSLSHCS